MNRPSRTDEPQKGDGYNQSPNPFSNDLTTNEDLNGISNSRELKRGEALSIQNSGPDGLFDAGPALDDADRGIPPRAGAAAGVPGAGQQPEKGPSGSRVVLEPTAASAGHGSRGADDGAGDGTDAAPTGWRRAAQRLVTAAITFAKFIGPGFMVAVSYIDPGNYATDIAAGASYRYSLLFIVLLSNLFAIFLQSLSIKLGTVSGLNLAEACRAFLPRWLNYFLYVMAEGAIIATDIAEVIGTAIAINLLVPKIPLVAGCALSILDVMLILVFYRPNGSMRGLRVFEFFVMLLVLGVVVCFCIQLSMIHETPVGRIFRGYLPSAAVVQQQGLYQACGILGATVMPHSLYLGSGIVQARLREYDSRTGLLPAPPPQPLSSTTTSSSAASLSGDSVSGGKATYIPSLSAIRYSMKYSIAELAISLFTFALFVNSAILIVAGASLYNNPDALDADIFGIHDLLSRSLSRAAGTVFALALLLSGISAGIVCTISGQMVSEGQLNWKMKPWMRRLVTRSISITPSIIIAGAVGRSGLDAALNGSQVALSVALPFITAPLIWFTCRAKYMTVQPGMARFAVQKRPASSRPRRRFLLWGARPGDVEGGAGGAQGELDPPPRTLWGRILFYRQRGRGGAGAGADGLGDEDRPVNMANSWPVAALATLIWLVMAVMNVANLVLLGQGSS